MTKTNTSANNIAAGNKCLRQNIMSSGFLQVPTQEI